VAKRNQDSKKGAAMNNDTLSPLGNVITIDDERIKSHLDRMVRGSVEETFECIAGPGAELIRRPSSKPTRRYNGVVQCDGYAPYKKVPADRITVAFCWSHLRREFFKIAERGDAPIATEAVARIGQIYAIEKDLRGKSADERRAARFGLLTVIVTRSGGTRHAR
jgi:hypothetical protein